MLAVESRQTEINTLHAASNVVDVPPLAEIDVRSMSMDLARSSAQAALLETNPSTLTLNNMLDWSSAAIESRVARPIRTPQPDDADDAFIRRDSDLRAERSSRVGEIAVDEVRSDLGARVGLREVSRIENAAASLAESAVATESRLFGAKDEPLEKSTEPTTPFGTRQEVFVLSDISLHGFEALLGGAESSSLTIQAPRLGRTSLPVAPSVFDELTVPGSSSGSISRPGTSSGPDSSNLSTANRPIESAAAIDLSKETISFSY